MYIRKRNFSTMYKHNLPKVLPLCNTVGTRRCKSILLASESFIEVG